MSHVPGEQPRSISTAPWLQGALGLSDSHQAHARRLQGAGAGATRTLGEPGLSKPGACGVRDAREPRREESMDLMLDWRLFFFRAGLAGVAAGWGSVVGGLAGAFPHAGVASPVTGAGWP